MSNAEKTIEAYQRENEKLRKDNLSLEIENKLAGELIKQQEQNIKFLQHQNELLNALANKEIPF